MKRINLLILLLLTLSYSCKKDKSDNDINEFDEITGCTDENADNFNSLATLDDGSCEFSFFNQFSGNWNIVSLEYQINIDLNNVNLESLEEINPLITNFLPFIGNNLSFDGTADNVGSLNLNNLGYYESDISFNTEPINILSFEIPGFPLNLTSNGNWEISDNNEIITLNDSNNGLEQTFNIISFSENFALIRGENVPFDIGQFGNFGISLELTLIK